MERIDGEMEGKKEEEEKNKKKRLKKRRRRRRRNTKESQTAIEFLVLSRLFDKRDRTVKEKAPPHPPLPPPTAAMENSLEKYYHAVWKWKWQCAVWRRRRKKKKKKMERTRKKKEYKEYE
ncbi:hypothetical protein E2C01_101145 [Portunus trituberculatus]|uniref:Uncharacterized protein n=1 Tax=Portunus trituberculatus TaxID=210409 RepID=A0A5B7KL82_PORTR|nr:hypothetical protein [Portunus trituberculatus]